jgi:spore maturation protein CgeB
VSNYRFVFLGLSITSSWGNGHATTYRALLKALQKRGHELLFLERDLPFYAENRDLVDAPFARVELYGSLADLKGRFEREVREADLVVVGSYVPEGIAVGTWVTEIAAGRCAFYDIDTPITLARLWDGDAEYVSRALMPRYDLYLSFTGGPTLDLLAQRFGVRRPRPLYCSVDPEAHFPEPASIRWDLGYLGTYSADRQPALDRLLIEPARRRPAARFAVAGAQYPEELVFPPNVHRRDHIAPAEHRAFYCAQRFTLNVTRRDMRAAGYSPSVRLFEAAACGVPVVSDAWPGLESFFTPGDEILVAREPEDTLRILDELSEQDRHALGRRARARVLAAHTAAHRAEALTEYTAELHKKAPACAPGA